MTEQLSFAYYQTAAGLLETGCTAQAVWILRFLTGTPEHPHRPTALSDDTAEEVRAYLAGGMPRLYGALSDYRDGFSAQLPAGRTTDSVRGDTQLRRDRGGCRKSACGEGSRRSNGAESALADRALSPCLRRGRLSDRLCRRIESQAAAFAVGTKNSQSIRILIMRQRTS